MNLVLSYEPSALAAPQSFLDAMQTAANILDSTIKDNITVTILVGYGDWDNGLLTTPGNTGMGGDLYGAYVSYGTLKAALASHETSALDQSYVNALPNTSSLNGVSSFYVPSSVEKALGLISPNATAIDGAIGIGMTIPTNLLVGVALHELTHAMGREHGTGTFDFGRYTSPGVHLFSSSNTAPASYFSVDGGVTKIADLGQTSDPGDMLNTGVQGYNDPFNEFYSGTTTQSLTQVDLQILDALGFNVSGAAVPGAPSATTSGIVAGSPTLTADGNSTTTLTVTIMDANGNAVAGTAVTLSASGSDNHFGAISGTTDAHGVFTTTLSSTLAQTETITATAGSVHETTSVNFVAPSQNVIESLGSTGLVEIGKNFYFNGAGATAELKYGGAAVVAGQFGDWTPIGAEQTATGYQVAWKVASTDQYSVWSTDSSGNYLSNAVGSVSGNNTSLQAIETSFHQDLNGDGVIGIPPIVVGPTTTVIESFGSTILTSVGNNFFINVNINNNTTGGGAIPELKYGGAAVVAGQFGDWTPIGAEQTATGYEVAWKVSGTDQYSVWSTDSSGNYLSNAVGSVSGNNTSLQAIEASFHQDLNGDGIIGVPTSSVPPVTTIPTTVIEAFGSTSLTQVGPNFYLNSTTSGTGPELKYGGAAVAAGQFGPWTPIAVEQTATGYQVAWKIAATNQYSVWNTDSNGNYVSNATDAVSATSASLQSTETKFHQDLNGDGTVGAPTGGAQAVDALAHQSFVFVANFGQVIINSFAPATDTIQLSHANFADIGTLIAAAHDDGHGNVVFTDAAHDTLTIQNLSVAAIQAHQSAFHIT